MTNYQNFKLIEKLLEESQIEYDIYFRLYCYEIVSPGREDFIFDMMNITDNDIKRLRKWINE